MMPVAQGMHPSPLQIPNDVIKSMLDSQNKTVQMLETFTKRIDNLEKTVSNIAAKSTDASADTAPEEPKRLPQKLSVSVIHVQFLCVQYTRCMFSYMYLLIALIKL